MKMRSTNWYYMIGLLPVTILDFCLGMYLARSKWWLVLILGTIGMLLCMKIVKKFYCVPYSEKSYGAMKPISFSLPVPYEVEVYSCESMAAYDFLNRVAEVISPMKWKGSKVKVAVNPEILKKKGTAFMQMAAVRELRRYETGVAWKTLLLLCVPVEMIMAVVLFVFAFQIDIMAYTSFFFANFLLPFLLVVLLGGVLFFWNRFISRQDVLLDQYLLQWFSPGDVEFYIRTVEEMEQKQEGEKNHTFSQHYAQERIEKLNHKS